MAESMTHPDFRSVFGNEMADRIEELQRESVRRRETHWERSQRRLAEQQEHQRRVRMAQACLNGSNGDDLRERAEELLGQDPEWANVTKSILEELERAVDEERRNRT
jgi:hypothetical protein